MKSRQQRLVGCGLVAALALAGCAGPEEIKDACMIEPPGSRGLAGFFNGQPEGIPTHALVPITGQATRKGALRRIEFDDFTFKAKADAETGALTARTFLSRASGTAEPIAPLTEGLEEASPGVGAYSVSYSANRNSSHVGQVVIGPPTPDAVIATLGQARYKGAVTLNFSDLGEKASDEPVVLTGTATLDVRYAAKIASLVVENIKREKGRGALPFARIEWTDLSLCGARIGSTGSGGFAFYDKEDTPVNFAGTEDGAPAASAEFNARFFGLSDKSRPQSLGGGLLIQGDTGMISGMFVLTPPK